MRYARSRYGMVGVPWCWFSEPADVDDRVGERLWGVLGEVVPDSVDCAV